MKYLHRLVLLVARHFNHGRVHGLKVWGWKVLGWNIRVEKSGKRIYRANKSSYLNASLKYIHSFFATILGTSHCVDMYSNRPGDSDELQGTRAMIGDLVSKWIMEANAWTLTKTYYTILWKNKNNFGRWKSVKR